MHIFLILQQIFRKYAPGNKIIYYLNTPMIFLGDNFSKVALEMYYAFIWKVTGVFNVESIGTEENLGGTVSTDGS